MMDFQLEISESHHDAGRRMVVVRAFDSDQCFAARKKVDSHVQFMVRARDYTTRTNLL